MSPRFSVRAALVPLAAVVTITAIAPIASAQTDIQGHWSGFSEHGIIDPGPPQVDVSFFDVFAQSRGRFQGAIGVPAVQDPVPHLFPVAGFVRSDGTMGGSGRDREGNSIAFAGRARIIDPNSIIDPNLSPVVFMSLRYRVTDAFGNLLDRGVTVQIQMQGGLNWTKPGPISVPDVTGRWTGSWLPSVGPGGGCLEMDLAQIFNDNTGLPTSGIRGGGNMEDAYDPASDSFFDVFFDLQGTIGLPAVQRDQSLASPFGAVGIVDPGPPSLEGGVVLFIGTWSKPGPIGVPAVQGNYLLFDSFFDVFTEVVFGTSTSVGGGTWIINPGPPT